MIFSFYFLSVGSDFVKTTYLCPMKRLFTHIERLLLTNDCVIIPEFGGFVVHPCPAVYKSEEHGFYPPGKGIVFNPQLKHYDRLLPESYIQMYGISFEEAHISLRKDIEELYQTLAKDGSVYFEKIGFLRKDNTGQLFFEVERNASFVGLKPFGLYPFHLPSVVHDEQKTKTEPTKPIKHETKNKRMVYLPVNRVFLRVAGVSAAAVALFLFVSIPVNDVGRSSYSAGLIPSEIISSSVCVSDTQRTVTQESVLEIDVIEHTVVSEEIPPSPIVQESPPTVKTEERTQRVYYAIIGSFVTESQANRFMQQINMPELTTMGIVINEERVRVYAGKFDNREEAQNYIYRLRANEKLKDTWLFVGQ